MTFPKIELLCAECKTPMELMITSDILDSKIKGFDKYIELHFKCKGNERHNNDNYCGISRKKAIQIFRIHMPILTSD